MRLMCALWRVDRTCNVLVGFFNESDVALDFLKTKPIETICHYYLVYCPICRE